MSDNPHTIKSARTPQEEIERLSKLSLDMVRMLRAQQELLTQRGIALKKEALDGLQGVGVDLSSLATELDDNQIELLQLRALARTTELINSSLDLDFILDDVVDTVVELTGAERGYIVLREPGTGELDFKVARSYRQTDLSKDEMLISRTVVERVAQLGELILTTNAQEDTRFNKSDSIYKYMMRSILCVPLKRKGQVTGVIYADNRLRQNLFTEREQNVVMAFANQAAVAIENARLFERLRASLAEITAIRDLMDNVLTSIASGVITTDREYKILTMNSAAARILALPLEDIIGLPLLSVIPAFDGLETLLLEVRERNKEQLVEIDPIVPNRGHVSLTLRFSPLKDSAEGVTQGIALVVDDLTELRQRQSRLNVVRRYLSSEMVDNIHEIDELELSGVERDISIVYCDVRGFTTFSEQLQPEVLMETINKYLSCSSSAIDKFKGIIDKYMGDAVVGLFNTQLNPQTDHAWRAVAAALTMAQMVYQLNQGFPEDQRLYFGIGVHSGPAVLGNVGSPSRKEFTAIGDSLQFAKLLQENALGSEVIISQETYDLLKERLTAEPLTPRKDKESKETSHFRVMYRVTALV